MRINRDILLAVIVALMIVGIGFITPGFVQPHSLVGLFNDTSILIMVVLGQMTVILTKCIDLSVGANIALTGVLVALVNAAHPEVPIPLLMLLATGIGLGLGAFNGAMVWLVGIPPIVVTLGTLSIYRGLAFVASGGTSIVGRQMSAAFIAVPRTEILGLPVMSWFAVVLVIVFFFVHARHAHRPRLLRHGRQSDRRRLYRHQCRPDPVHRLLHLRHDCRLLRLPLGLALHHRLCRHRRRFRARGDRLLRHRRRFDRRRHRHRARRRAWRAVPRRRQRTRCR